MYNVVIDNFDGPLDLLLHLIKIDDIDIVDISIEKITKQYLDYITAMEQMNLNIASEYLVMAAELIEMKSSILLPKREDTIEEEIDPRENLINRLLEYKKYKEIIPEFKELEQERKMIITKIGENLSNYGDKNLDFKDVNLDTLMEAFANFLKRKDLEKPLNTKITKREYSVSKRSHEIKKILLKKKKVEFEELFDIVKKDYIVVTFLSILDLAKKQELVIDQNENFNKIYLSLRGCE